MRNYLIRHCESTGQPRAFGGDEVRAHNYRVFLARKMHRYLRVESDRFMGLSKRGQEEEAVATGEAMAAELKQNPPEGKIYIRHSPYKHARHTAMIIRDALQKHGIEAELVAAEELQDIHHGSLWGLSPRQRQHRKETNEEFNAVMTAYEEAKKDPEKRFVTAPPRGESPRQLMERAGSFLEKWKNGELEGGKPGDVNIFVTHSFVICALLAHLLHWTTEQFINGFTPPNGSIRLLEGKDADHLQDKGFVFEGLPLPTFTRESPFALLPAPWEFSYRQQDELTRLKSELAGSTIEQAAQRLASEGSALREKLGVSAEVTETAAALCAGIIAGKSTESWSERTERSIDERGEPPRGKS